MNLLNELLRKNHKLHFSLIDPASQAPDGAGEMAEVCGKYGTNAIMVGGSTVYSRKIVFDTVEAIKRQVELPIILFPNSAEAISENADYIFFMTLLNSAEDRYKGGEQSKGAPLIKKWGIKPISMGYVVVSTSKKPTTIERLVKLDRISNEDIEKATNHALRAEMSGMSCVYFDAGSGAEQPVANELIAAVRKAVEIPIIVGGGIRNRAVTKEKIDAGADIIVTGTIIEKDKKAIKAIIESVHSRTPAKHRKR